MTPLAVISLLSSLAAAEPAPSEARSHVVAVKPTATTGCPAPADVEAALRPLLRPGALVAFDAAAPPPDMLLVSLEPTGATGSRMRLTDRQGKAVLERALVVAEGEGNKDCAALADTAALIVERYLIQLDYKPPPPAAVEAPPPPGRWDLSAASMWLPGASGVSPLEIGGRVGRQLGGHRRFVLALGARVGGETDPLPRGSAYRGSARQRRVPVDLGLWWRTGLGALELQAGSGVGLDITRITSEGDPGMVENRILPGPAAWLAAAARMPLGSRVFGRISSAVYGSLVQYDFSYRTPGTLDGVTAFTTPTRRFYSRLGVELGVVLP